MLIREKWKKKSAFSFAHWYQVTSGLIPLARSHSSFRKWQKTPFRTRRFPFVLRVVPQASPLSFYTEVAQNSSEVERTNEDLSSKRSYMIDPDWYDHIWTELFHKDKPLSFTPIRSSRSAVSDIKKNPSTVNRKSVPNVIVKTITVVKLLITP